MTSPLLDATDPRPVHFIGIAGAGMSALAELLTHRGVAVVGTDANPGGAPDLLGLGIAVSAHDAELVGLARAVVYSSAISAMHPEMLAARRLELPIIRRAEALADAVSGGTLVGVAGTHGKTTTTVMTTEALAAAGRDPTGVVGGRVGSWGGNLRLGALASADPTYVVEADEYDRSFLALTPHIAVVLNVEADHLDIYRDLDDIERAFELFVSPARVVVRCADDNGAMALESPPVARSSRIRRRCKGVTRAACQRRSARGARPVALAGRFAIRRRVRWGIAGRRDAVCSGRPQRAKRAGRHWQRACPRLHRAGHGTRPCGLPWCGAPVSAIGLRWRRRRRRRLCASSHRGVRDTRRGTERVSASSHRARVPAALYSRTRDLQKEFAESLSAADVLFLCDIYGAREAPEPGVTSALIGDRVAPGVLQWTGPRAEAAAALKAAVQPGDVVLTMGAGDITRTGPELLSSLRA